MSKYRTSFVCLSCQNRASKWSGKCPSCGEWNTLEEDSIDDAPSQSVNPAELFTIDQIADQSKTRISSGLIEFDRVLGSEKPGIVPGSVILVAGNPGVGKSTLLLQVAEGVKECLYFSAEESLEQIKIRAERLKIKSKSFLVSAERDINKIFKSITNNKPKLVIIDSIQTVFDETAVGTPGSVNQVREIAWRVQKFAKISGVAFVLVGHVTKEGIIAGPKVLEHLVDVVMSLEGEKRTGLRLLQAQKNRYGPLDEVGIYQLTNAGFVTVDDPGKMFASLINEKLPGRALSVTAEGSRSFLLEIQALTTKTSFGYAKRSCQGIDANRLNVILAVLENRLGVATNQFDIFVNVVGGFNIKDPGIDLAIAGAILSSLNKKILPDNVVLIGEIGLLGEVRPAHHQSLRVKEVKRLGLRTNQAISSIENLNKLFVTTAPSK